ncbi:MAG: hypothetical protein ACRDZW_08220 [Acidimicrobiales bacterium]
MVKNRDRWTVETVHRDGSLSVSGRTGRVRLPADYVAEHVELAYAEASHANQGRTVDRSFLYLDGPTGASGIYVPMIRGRESNDAFVVLRWEETPADVVVDALARSWVDRPAIEVRAELGQVSAAHSEGWRQPLAASEVRPPLERDAELDRGLAGARSDLDRARRQVASLARERELLSRSIGEYEARLEGVRGTLDAFDRPLLWRRHRVEVEGARRQLAWIPGAIDRERSQLSGLRFKEDQAAERMLEAVKVDASRPKMLAERPMVRYQLNEDARLRGDRLALDLPGPVVEHIGPKPAGRAVASLWLDAAGRLAAASRRIRATGGYDPG